MKGQYSSSCVGIAKFGCREVWNYLLEVIPLTHSDIGILHIMEQSVMVYEGME